jgi:acyl-CoA dehydrogenase
VRDDILGHLLRAASTAAECPDVERWWPAFRELARTWRNPMDRALATGFAADRVAWAFAAGYQCALQALFPELPEDALAALCVTEEQGNHPRAIRTTLRRAAGGWRLDGAKRWTTLGPQGALFLVLARDAQVEGERPALKVARVPSAAGGVRIETMPATRFVPEVPHARLFFEGVALDDDALLPGDGWTLYAKPFRSVEDAHVNAALLAYLLREARRLGWPHAWIERGAALLLALRALAAEDPSRAQTHIALAGILEAAAALVSQAEAHWSATPEDPARGRWLRDRELLNVAASARAQRSASAWRQLAGALRPTPKP